MTEIATALIEAVHRAGGTVSLDGTNLRLEAPAPLSNILRASLRQHKPALVAFLTETDAVQRTAHHSALGSQVPTPGNDCTASEEHNRKPQRTAHNSTLSSKHGILGSGCIGVQLNTVWGTYKESQLWCAVRCGAVGRHQAYLPVPKGKLTQGRKSSPDAPANPVPGKVAKSALSALYPPCLTPKTPLLPVEPGPWSSGIPDDVARGIGALLVAPTATGIPDQAWPIIVADTVALVDSGQAAQAFALGWSAADLFGCDRRAPWHRLDRMGMTLLAGGREVFGFTRTFVLLRSRDGAVLCLRRSPKPIEPPVAMLWHLLPQHLRPLVGPAP